MSDSVISFKSSGPHEFTIGDRAQLTVTEQAITIHLGPGQYAVVADDGVVIILPKADVDEHPKGVGGPTPFQQPTRTLLYPVPDITKVDEQSGSSGGAGNEL